MVLSRTISSLTRCVFGHCACHVEWTVDVVLQNTHGITNRMTGGGTGRCLQTTESGGMGEGWSDAMAEWLEHKDATVPDYVLGQYVINDASGIRSHPYSTSA